MPSWTPPHSASHDANAASNSSGVPQERPVPVSARLLCLRHPRHPFSLPAGLHNPYPAFFPCRVQISDCVDCRIIVGPCTGSVFLLDCTGCTISVAAKQLRLRDCTHCTLRTYAPTSESVVIETCHDLRFGAWDVAYAGLSAQFAAIPDWDVKRNFWNKIYDFSPPAEATAPKHYTLLPISHNVLERQGCKRWSELTLAPEGLTGGSVTETRVSTGTTPGCECPLLSADGEKYSLPAAEAPAAAVTTADGGASGYARMFANPPAAEDDGATGYARMYGGGASQPAAAAPAPAEAPPAKGVATDTDMEAVVLTESAAVEGAPPTEQPTLFRQALEWLSSWFGGSSRRC